MDAVTAPTLAGPRVTLRAFTDADAAARQRHGWHREIERGYGSDRDVRPMTDDEVEAWAELPRRQDARRGHLLGGRGRAASSSEPCSCPTSVKAAARRAWPSGSTRRS